MKLYALHDRKAQSFSSFHVERSDAVASRNFASAVMERSPNGGQSHLAMYHEDYELVSVCDVHDCYEASSFETHVTVGLVDHKVIITATQVLAAQPRDGQLSLLKEA